MTCHFARDAFGAAARFAYFITEKDPATGTGNRDTLFFLKQNYLDCSQL